MKKIIILAIIIAIALCSAEAIRPESPSAAESLIDQVALKSSSASARYVEPGDKTVLGDRILYHKSFDFVLTATSDDGETVVTGSTWSYSFGGEKEQLTENAPVLLVIGSMSGLPMSYASGETITNGFSINTLGVYTVTDCFGSWKLEDINGTWQALILNKDEFERSKKMPEEYREIARNNGYYLVTKSDLLPSVICHNSYHGED